VCIGIIPLNRGQSTKPGEKKPKIPRMPANYFIGAGVPFTFRARAAPRSRFAPTAVLRGRET
jgi:hypothetical protein